MAHSIAIDLGRGCLRAVEVSAGRNQLTVERVLSAAVPDELDREDPVALGRWVGQRLSDEGMSRSGATITFGREHVAIKHLTLPSTDPNELPDMVRLAIQQQMHFDAADAVIDFLPLNSDANSTTLLVAALPATQVEQARTMARSAGIKVARESLRCLGTTTLLRELGGQFEEGILGIDVTGEGIELCVVADGGLRHSRGVETPWSNDRERFAQTIVTETRRSWVSYRIVKDDSHVRRAVLMAEEGVAEAAAVRIGEVLSMNVDVLSDHPLVETNGCDMAGVWPLIGLLLEPVVGAEMIDFARPRKAPDLAARKRQQRLAVAGAAVVVLIGGWVVGNLQLKELRADFQALDQTATRKLEQIHRFERDEFKLQHLRQWNSIGVDWLDHLGHLYRITPPPGDVVLDSWEGVLATSGIEYDKRAEEGDRWTVDAAVEITVEGTAKDREQVAQLRRKLVADERYVLRVQGKDVKGNRSDRLDYPFACVLRSDDANAEEQVTEANDSAPANQLAGRGRRP